MISIIITGVLNERKIQAIKGVRALTGLGLKEAKAVIDGVQAGTPYTISVTDMTIEEVTQLCDDHSIEFRLGKLPDKRIIVLEVLDEIDPDLTVRQVYQVLRAVSPDWRSGHYEY